MKDTAAEKQLKKPSSISAILHDIRSSHNVGSMFRTADALGVEKLFLTGYTPAPKDKFNRPNKEISKVALGGEMTVAWEFSEDVFDVIKKLKKAGVEIVAIEQSSKSVDYKDFSLSGPTTFIFGNEVDGVPEKILDLCDKIVSIPMKGKKESLNVSVAFGIALARITNA